MRGADTWPVQIPANGRTTANGERLNELQAPILRKRKEEPSSMGYRGGFRGEEEVEPMAHDIMGLLPSSWVFFVPLPSDIPGSHNMRFTFCMQSKVRNRRLDKYLPLIHVASKRTSLTPKLLRFFWMFLLHARINYKTIIKTGAITSNVRDIHRIHRTNESMITVQSDKACELERHILFVFSPFVPY